MARRLAISSCLFFLTFWPASLLAGMAVPGVWREKWETPVKFLLAWLIPAWLVFEIVITKLPHYVLPLYPAIAILLARAIETGQMSSRKWMEWGTFWWFAVPVLVFVGSLFLLLRYEGDLGWRAWPFLAAAIVFGFRAWWLYDVDGIERSLLRASVTTLAAVDCGLLVGHSRARGGVSERLQSSEPYMRPNARIRGLRPRAITSRAWCFCPGPIPR